VREALFSRLEHLGAVRGARVLDLYAGSGALGIEAASRGAVAVTLVDSARAAADVCRSNVAALGLRGVDVVAQRAERFVQAPVREPWDLVLVDPPYELTEPELATVLAALTGADGRAPDPAGDRTAARDRTAADDRTAARDRTAAHDRTAARDGALADGAVVVVERSSRSPEPTWPPGLVRTDRRAYGETVVWFASPAGG
jgi:16S rRNA (guanine966-N2)-methyltransferase